MYVPERSSRKVKGEMVAINTTNILFIASGAFNGLDKIIARRKNEKVCEPFCVHFNSVYCSPDVCVTNCLYTTQVIGFGPMTNTNTLGRQIPASDQMLSVNNSEPESEERHKDGLLRTVDSRDLMDFGMIPEFVGRFPVVVTLTSLDTPALVEILTKPKNALVSQYIHLFEMDQVGFHPHTHTISTFHTLQVKLEFTQEALFAIARCAIEKRTGARGLRTIMVSRWAQHVVLGP